MRFDFNTAVLERENFDRWLFPDDLTERRTAGAFEGYPRCENQTRGQGAQLTDGTCEAPTCWTGRHQAILR